MCSNNSDLFRMSFNTFTYKCQKPPNGKTRIYFSVDPESKLIGEQLYLLNSDKEVVKHVEIQIGASLEIQPAIFGIPEYTISFGENCKDGKNCPFSR